MTNSDGSKEAVLASLYFEAGIHLGACERLVDESRIAMAGERLGEASVLLSAAEKEVCTIYATIGRICDIEGSASARRLVAMADRLWRHLLRHMADCNASGRMPMKDAAGGRRRRSHEA